jgi:hypothetical protein
MPLAAQVVQAVVVAQRHQIQPGQEALVHQVRAITVALIIQLDQVRTIQQVGVVVLEQSEILPLRLLHLGQGVLDYTVQSLVHQLHMRVVGVEE